MNVIAMYISFKCRVVFKIFAHWYWLCGTQTEDNVIKHKGFKISLKTSFFPLSHLLLWRTFISVFLEIWQY